MRGGRQGWRPRVPMEARSSTSRAVADNRNSLKWLSLSGFGYLYVPNSTSKEHPRISHSAYFNLGCPTTIIDSTRRQRYDGAEIFSTYLISQIFQSNGWTPKRRPWARAGARSSRQLPSLDLPARRRYPSTAVQNRQRGHARSTSDDAPQKSLQTGAKPTVGRKTDRRSANRRPWTRTWARSSRQLPSLDLPGGGIRRRRSTTDEQPRQPPSTVISS
ncbi:hypothetical protein THAOC_02268 [Thalassiosira oceanica]|uniref:Uncharacterized protein n=1 Tax=Thalassiosira oceanica TaxID=159749 RepID=K0TEZ9_THAOC|nr:hypothetical protein THAOC_02268 [Thalassiosira oceanica]|eukprot:EJK75995.1 hypothetical protein THAOC_02268 [Thalassiosira oceanica]